MISFRRFLLEKIRSDQQAIKLGTYVAKRHGKQNPYVLPMYINHKDYHSNADADEVLNTYDRIRKKLKRPVFLGIKPTTVDVGSLKSTQPNTKFLATHAKDKLDDEDPINVIKYKNQHYVVDGHHRVIAKKLKRIKQINAKVYDYDQENK